MTAKRWLGSAISVVDLWTISLSGTVISQTYTMTINGKSVTYTASGSDTVATIFIALVAAWAASLIPEFVELMPAGLPSAGPFTSMTLTQKTSGIPSVIAVATSGAATFTIANTTPATGANFFDNAQNWAGGVAPVNSDNLIFDNGSVNCSYNINSSLTGIVLNVNTGYSGQIGLPLINAAGNYNEYRTTSLTFAGGTAVVNCPTIPQCNLAFGANTAMIRIIATGARINPSIPVVLLLGGNGSSELDISKGDVGIGFYGGAYDFPVIKTGYVTNLLTDVSLICGSGGTLGAITKNGGGAIISANATTITQDVAGGVLTITDAVTVTTLNAYAGNVNLNTVGTVGTINLYNSANLTCDGDPRGKTITNAIQIFSQNVTVTDSGRSINSGTRSFALNGCSSFNYFLGGLTSLVAV